MAETRSEIEQLISNAQKKFDMDKQIIKDCDKQIARLKPVYQKLSEIKADFRNARKNAKEIFEERREWHGEKYASFCNMGDGLDGTYEEYYKRLDAAQDAVNGKISELEAKKQELTPIIGKLLGQLEKWRAEIENAWN